MYPISAGEKLSLLDISDHWAGEIQPRRSCCQLFEILVKAWWRGEFGPSEAARRPTFLRLLHKYYHDRIAFAVPGREEPEMTRDLPDGGVEIVRFGRVPLPNNNPSLWNEVNCGGAFDAVAEVWRPGEFALGTKSLQRKVERSRLHKLGSR
jgi:hypothetical protein